MERNISTFHSLAKNLNKIHKTSCEGVTVVQSSILHEISLHDNPSMQTVANALGMDITTFSRQIGTLEKIKLIKRIPYSKDRRILLLTLTETGQNLVGEINNHIGATMEASLSSMNDFERETVMRSMHLLSEKLKSIEK
ncbi:MarR family winged helix-turn-helix transcriptional regulator [Sporosarcina jiandibaonis]|uniref:MarR family winged helix-turn-helix transcriptional regulator n=1 Tax=Sporosarcina jiandibaonis TaxID=2715535 RepID=UPI0015557D66|nr:MarR family transcriptional regulator [Sporosarcina jiandibaonis]